ncbi:MAG: HupE/UreJ family protein [Pseudorhodoplanes sp.]|nr:HupE/UreJ family protein [Pseudorhodoplanes sp.]
MKRFAAAILVAMAEPALAHHAMDGQMPVTWGQGFVSGLAHPVLGLDHFAALIAVGSLAALARTGMWPILAYVALMIAGAALHAAGVTIPAAEPGVALSLLLLGAVLAGHRLRFATILLVLFGATGLVHGYALGESIVGAEPAPLVAYFAGLAVVQSAIAVGTMMAARAIMDRYAAWPLRLAGAAVAGFGLATLTQALSA